jgi:glutamate-1-semialdehyde 2,1-aminomutase
LNGHLLSGLSPAGVPRQLAGTSLPFTYNKLDELTAIVRQHGKKLAAVVMEPTRNTDPLPGFLEGIRGLCEECGALLVFDEISAGWRFHFGGSHLQYAVAPDIAVFEKALGNGHPVAAVIGNATAMSAVQASFISSTYWTEAVGPAAALATIAKMRSFDVPSHVGAIGAKFREGLASLGEVGGVPVKVAGHSALLTIAFDCPEPAAVMTLFTVRMLDRGFLCGSSFYPSFAHNESHLAGYLNAAGKVFGELADAIVCGDALTRVGGHVKNTGFRRLT